MALGPDHLDWRTLGLILDHGRQAAERGIRQALGEAVIGQHAFDVKILHDDDLHRQRDLQAGLVEKVSASVGVAPQFLRQAFRLPSLAFRQSQLYEVQVGSGHRRLIALLRLGVGGDLGSGTMDRPRHLALPAQAGHRDDMRGACVHALMMREAAALRSRTCC